MVKRLDIAAQAIQVTNVAKIYMLDESSHSRINTIYMTSFFVGGALGTLTGVLCRHYGGRTWVNLQMLILAPIILALLIREIGDFIEPFRKLWDGWFNKQETIMKQYKSNK